ncbi:hypothetical protein M6B38_106650 [Iris pallida]|uniref:Uncharacterized protein n=1 Tax=Iris pallida TaxID=29817 RepID=A0AAX6ERP9_IRIPA|nr:hypothetical protein M6B38_106650 [Iris pallida]
MLSSKFHGTTTQEVRLRILLHNCFVSDSDTRLYFCCNKRDEKRKTDKNTDTDARGRTRGWTHWLLW